MESLTPAQKTAVTKSSTERLRLLLLKGGYAEEVVLGWTREQLMSKYAELLAQGWDPATAVRAADPEVEKMRLAHEKEMKEKEMEMKQLELEVEKQRKEMREKELEAENQRKEKEVELREKELEAEKERKEMREKELDLKKAELAQKERLEAQRLEFEREKLKSETKLKSEEIDMKEKAQNDEMKMIKRYGDALTQVLSPQPDEVTDLPAYFRGVEEQFEKLKIPNKFRARLIYKYLSARARTLCSRLEPEVRDDYDKMKKAVLKEYGLTAKCFLEKFNTMRKPFHDTYILFTSKLRGLLLQYLNARKVSSFDEVVSLLVADRVKSSLTEQCLKHVLSVENNLPADGKQWLEPQRLSEIVDEFMSYTGVSGTRASYISQTPNVEERLQSREFSKTAAEGKPSGFSRYNSFHRDGSKAPPQNQTPAMNTFGRRWPHSYL